MLVYYANEDDVPQAVKLPDRPKEESMLPRIANFFGWATTPSIQVQNGGKFAVDHHYSQYEPAEYGRESVININSKSGKRGVYTSGLNVCVSLNVINYDAKGDIINISSVHLKGKITTEKLLRHQKELFNHFPPGSNVKLAIGYSSKHASSSPHDKEIRFDGHEGLISDGFISECDRLCQERGLKFNEADSSVYYGAKFGMSFCVGFDGSYGELRSCNPKLFPFEQAKSQQNSTKEMLDEFDTLPQDSHALIETHKVISTPSPPKQTTIDKKSLPDEVTSTSRRAKETEEEEDNRPGNHHDGP